MPIAPKCNPTRWLNVLALAGIATFASIPFVGAADPEPNVIQWGGKPMPNNAHLLTNVVSVAASNNGLEAFALRGDGTVVRWTLPSDGIGSASIVPGLTGAVAIASHNNSRGFLALKSDGTVVDMAEPPIEPLDDFWCENYGCAPFPSGLNDVAAIALGGMARLAIRANGELIVWGYGYAAVNVPEALTNVVAIAAGGQYWSDDDTAVAMKADGTLIQWGGSHHSTPAPWSGSTTNLGDISALAVGANFVLAMRTDGTVARWGGVSNEAGLTASDEVVVTVLPYLRIATAAAIMLEGAPGQTFRIDYTEALAPPDSWQPLAEVTLTNTTQHYIDADSIDRLRRFYRAELLSAP